MGEEINNRFEKPLILREGGFKKSDLEKIKKTRKIWKIIDVYKDQLSELFEILNPNKPQDGNRLSEFLKENSSPNPNLKGSWVYFPWNGLLIHMLNEADYYTLRTNRNRDIINQNEQKILKNFSVGIAGLSIGSNMALTLAHLGVSKNLKIADFDTLTTSNLNRVPAVIYDIGSNKSVLAAQKLHEIDPFIDLQIFETGLSKRNLENFLVGKKKLNIVVDAIDDFEIKIRLRVVAKKLRIPILMVTNLGDSCLVDVERYDLNQKTEFFNGLLGNLPKEILSSKLSEADKTRFAAKIVGVEHIPTRALESLSKIGKALVGRPQLASTVSIGAGIATYIIRKIAIEGKWPSKRLLLHFDSAFLDTKDASKIYDSEQGRKNLIRKMGL